MELNKLCRTCLSGSECMNSLYETCSTSTQICCAEMLSTFTPLTCCKDDGLPTMICHNCIGELNRCYLFQLKCLESDGVLRKHIQRVTGVAGAIITVANEQTESSNQQLDLIKLEEDMDEDSRIFEEVLLNNEYSTSSKKVIPAKSIEDPLSISEIQEDLNQVLDIVKHEIDVDIKIVKDEDINIEVCNAPVSEQEKEKPYLCTICNKSYKKRQNLQIHTRTHTGEKPYTCTVCNHSYRQEQHLINHMRTHTGEKHYSCTVCDSSFTTKQCLMSHMRTHPGAKPCPCTVCDRSFKSRSHLAIHMRTHTGEKPYSCTLCEKSFRQIYNFQVHMRTHTGEKPYTCSICNNLYRRKQHLTSHMRMHTGERPYSCTVCNRSYKQMHNLKTHMRTHTEVKPYAV